MLKNVHAEPENASSIAMTLAVIKNCCMNFIISEYLRLLACPPSRFRFAAMIASARATLIILALDSGSSLRRAGRNKKQHFFKPSAKYTLQFVRLLSGKQYKFQAQPYRSTFRVAQGVRSLRVLGEIICFVSLQRN